MRHVTQAVVFCAGLLVLAPAAAHADTYFSPFVGVNTGSGEKLRGSLDTSKPTFGLNLGGGLGTGVFATEIDFGYGPGLFGSESNYGKNSVLDFMGNLILGVPLHTGTGAVIEPYAQGGLGLIRTQIDGGALFHQKSHTNNTGFNVGGGLVGLFRDNLGIRADVRYFRTASGNIIDNFDLGNIHYWRATIGVVFW